MNILNMELELLEEKTIDRGFGDIVVRMYRNSHYMVREEKIVADGTVWSLEVRLLNREIDLPSILIDQDIRDFKIKGFYIETTSWGSLTKEDMAKKIEGYQIGITMVDMLEKKYL